MTTTIHRVLMTIGGFAAGLGGLMAGADVAPLGLPSEVGAWAAFIAGVTILLANSIRANFPYEDKPADDIGSTLG